MDRNSLELWKSREPSYDRNQLKLKIISEILYEVQRLTLSQLCDRVFIHQFLQSIVSSHDESAKVPDLAYRYIHDRVCQLFAAENREVQPEASEAQETGKLAI